MTWNARKGMPVILALAAIASTASNCKPALITVTQPVAGVVAGGSKTSVTWTTQNMVSDVKIDVTTDDGATFVNLVPALPFNAGPQEVTLPNPTDDVQGKAFIRVTNLDNTATFGNSAKFSITAMTERYLTFEEVRTIRPNAFPDNKQTAPTNCVYLGQVDGTLDQVKYAALPRGVLYRVKCTAGLGGRADPESFKDIVMSNGWVVSKVETLQGEKIGNANITCVLPTVGSTSPATTCHLAADNNGTNEFVVAILIKGRKGTSPF